MAKNNFSFFVVKKLTFTGSSKNCAYLREDDWDDWFEFSTMYDLIVFDGEGIRHDIGPVKIGQFGMAKDQRRPNLPKSFSELDERFFSLGQGEEYYEHLAKLDSQLKHQIATGLRDVVHDLALWERAKTEKVTEVSLTRSVSTTSIKGQYKRLLDGGVRLSAYDFAFIPPARENADKLKLEFHVKPESSSPTNVHVVIGRNGVGKTRMLNLMTKSLVAPKRSAAQSGKFTWEDDFLDPDSPFASVVTVSFSAFDETELFPEQTQSNESIKYHYVGLRRNTGDSASPNLGKPKSAEALAKEFVKSVMICLKGTRLARWRRALEMLESDPIFKESEVVRLARIEDADEIKSHSESLFKRLSSGHKIVLLTITRLVEVVEEKTLVLIDEPEAHLHPPLLSAFIRSLSDLLIDRNGVAIIATHSPVVLQEVPKTCVWMLRRSGATAMVERPECETFGENVGVLTREVFRLEVVQTGFHRLLTEAAERGGTFDEVSGSFNNELGAEARAILRALIATQQENGAG